TASHAARSTKRSRRRKPSRRNAASCSADNIGGTTARRSRIRKQPARARPTSDLEDQLAVVAAGEQLEHYRGKRLETLANVFFSLQLPSCKPAGELADRLWIAILVVEYDHAGHRRPVDEK